MTRGTRPENIKNSNTTISRDPNAMDIDKLSVADREKCVKEGLCFFCQKPNHTSRNCRTNPRNKGKNPFNTRTWGNGQTNGQPKTNNPFRQTMGRNIRNIPAVEQTRPVFNHTPAPMPRTQATITELTSIEERAARINALFEGLDINDREALHRELENLDFQSDSLERR